MPTLLHAEVLYLGIYSGTRYRMFFILTLSAAFILLVKGLLDSSLLYFLIAVPLALLSLNVIAYYGFQRTDFLSPLFIFTGVFFVSCCLGALLLSANGVYGEAVLNEALSYIIVFIVCFILGFSGKLGDRVRALLPTLNPNISPARLQVFTMLSVPLGLMLFFLSMRRAGLSNPMEVLENLTVFRKSWGQGGWAYLFTMAFFLLHAPFWGWLLVGPRTIVGRLIIGLYGFALVGISLLTGSRASIFSLIIGTIIVYHCRYRTIRPSMAIIVVALAVMPISAFYVVQGQFRGEQTNVERISELLEDVDLSQAIVALCRRFIDAFEGFITIVEDDFRQYEMLWG